ncbi:hypothetical protein T11_2655 [Trichinella zimbabwensis]|uniref:Uncharacterized protein n=1 Tax=Trichinella zimbabwensis TaxID=268475 RepID=A0A0V1GEA4_9BILA|nr:hypothetical protein T11_2655 [Trichinella zimbabwensis]
MKCCQLHSIKDVFVAAIKNLYGKHYNGIYSD